MREFLGGDEPYSKEHMKNKLMKTLNEDIVITNIQGKDSVVSIRVTAEKSLDQFWTQQKQQSETSEKFRIIYTYRRKINTSGRKGTAIHQRVLSNKRSYWRYRGQFKLFASFARFISTEFGIQK